MISARWTKLTFPFLATAVLMAVVATLVFATPNGVFAEAPERPTGLTATAVDHDTISLSWNHPDPASVDHYQVLSRRVGSGAGQLAQVGTSTTRSYEHDGLNPESTYVYRVRPVNSQGEEGRRSPRAEATTPAEETTASEPEPDPPPAQPQKSDGEGQNNIARSSHQIWTTSITTGTLSTLVGVWPDRSPPVGSITDRDFIYEGTTYRLSHIRVSSGGGLQMHMTSALSQNAIDYLTLNVAGSPFSLSSAATTDNISLDWNSAGLSWSNGQTIALTMTETATEPDATTGLTATGVGETEMKLSWTAPTDDGGDAITGYKVEVSSDGDTNWSDVVADTASTDTTYSHTGLSAGNTRFYRVSAINSVGTGDASNVGGATTAAANMLVSNTGRNVNSDDTDSIGDQDKQSSQGFDTGPNPGGYSLASVGVYVHNEDLEAGETFTVHIYTATSGGAPDDLLYTLTSPASYTDRAVNTFTAPAGATLDADTDYHVVFEATGNTISDFVIGLMTSNRQDTGTRAGWAIEDALRFNGTLDFSSEGFYISVNGSAIGTEVPSTWALVPSGLSDGDKFRLLFLSSTSRNAEANGINAYNTFIQDLANAGHTDIQDYSDNFRVVGCTSNAQATSNARTIYTTSNKGVPIYWLNGAKAADDYKDFYDGSWDDEANDKNELGTDGPDTSQTANYPYTGCDHDGTRIQLGSSDDQYLGDATVRAGRPNSSVTGTGPLSSFSHFTASTTHPFYGLSEIFQVAPSGQVLVSNVGQTSEDNNLTNDKAQPFTTGTNTGGYVLTSVVVAYNDMSGDAFTASVWTTDAAGLPDTLKHSLTAPSTLAAGNLVFTAPSNATLDANTTYTVKLVAPSGTAVTLKRTSTVNPDEDSGAAAGWSIADTYQFFETSSGTFTPSSSNKPMLIAIYGTITPSDDATLSGLTVNDGTNDLTLTPGFTSGTYVYETDVANSITTATLTATPNHSEAEVTAVTLAGTAIADTDFTDGITVPSLALNDNEIVLTVTAEDATTQPYTVTVTRAATPNSAPTFANSTYNRTVAENTAAGQNIGPTFTATDDDGDTLTYTLEGTDEASFDIVTISGAGQIRTKSGVTYNHEVRTAYTLTLKADDGNGGTDTATVNITVTDVAEPPGRPAAPSVSGTPGSDTSLTVSWNAPDNTGPDIDNYDLQYRQGNSGNFTNGPQNVNGLTATIPNLSANTSYQVQVRATNAEGDSPWSPSGSGSTSSPPVTPPGQVLGVNITAGNQILQVNWTQVSGATGYKVQWKSGGQSYNSSSRQATVSSGSTTSRTISNLQNGTEYNVRVIATKTGASDGVPSDEVDGTPTAATTAPSAPRNLNASASGDNRINLTWDAPSSDGGSNITGYKIQVSNNGNSWTDRVGNTGNANRTYRHTGLSAGDTRHYRVAAINSTGTGPYSNNARATTGLPQVNIGPAWTTEGGNIVFTITISPTIEGFRRIGYGTGTEDLPPGSMGARKGDDYFAHHPAGANVQIGYGLSSVDLTFETIDDDLVEGTEIFEIGLHGSAYEGRDFEYGDRRAFATIRDDENNGMAYQDSVPGDTSTSETISPGGSVTNRIETLNDADWYRTSLTKNHCYQVKVEGNSADETLTLLYPALRGVYRSDGTHIFDTYENAGGQGTTAIGNVKLDTTGTYYLAAGLYRFENGGTFRMSLDDLGTTDTACGAAKPGGP